MLDLWGLAAALTLIATRSSVAGQFKDAVIFPRLAQWTTRRGRWWADNIVTLVDCPMCLGFHLTIIAGLVFGSSATEMCVSYLCLVLYIACYDALVRQPDSLG